MIRENLDTARRQLLDLSGRNRLLNHRTTGQRTLSIVDEAPDEVYRLLVEDAKQMQFLAIEESTLLSGDAPGTDTASAAATAATVATESDIPGEAEGTPPEGEAPASGERDLTERLFELAALDASASPERRSDLLLQTTLAGTQLQRRLLNLSRVAESALQEQGANVLYLALGTVIWRESGESNETRRAPLLLIPVELTRRNVNSRHRVRQFDDEIQTNPALHELCAQIFRASLPLFDPDAEPLHPPTAPAGTSPLPGPIGAYFEAVRTSLTDPLGWQLVPEINLAIFSFAKLLMYRDLDDRNWPASAPISDNTTLARLFAKLPPDMDAPPAIPAEQLDERVPPQECFQVLDADASQRCAIEAAKSGRSLIIYGPPGTGKSQTISNIIAELLAEQKSVLFVAEKAAALDVVKARLDTVGLGDFVADLHSRKASKRDFAASLSASLESSFRHVPEAQLASADDLQRDRIALNRYVEALHTPRAPLNLSVFEVIGRTTTLGEAPTAPIDIPNFAEYDRDRLRLAEESVGAYARLLQRVGPVAAHPYRGTTIQELPLTTRQSLPILLGSLAETIGETIGAGEALASLLQIVRPASVDALAELSGALRAALALPASLRRHIADATWNEIPPEAAALIGHATRLTELRGALYPRWKPDAEETDWEPVAQRLRVSVTSPLRFFKPSWWGDRKRVRTAAQPGIKPFTSPDRLLADLTTLGAVRRVRDQLRAASIRGAACFAEDWKDDRSDPARLRSIAETIVNTRRVARARALDPGHVLTLLDGSAPALGAALDALDQHLARLADQFRAFAETLAIREGRFFSDPMGDLALEDIATRIGECAATTESLVDVAALNRARAACEAAGLESIVAWAESQGSGFNARSLLPAFQLQFSKLWLDDVVRSDPLLREFRADDHEALIARFRALDTQWIELSRRRAGARIAERRPKSRVTFASSSGLSILLAEAGKKRRHMPIRRFLAGSAGAVAQSLKPCFMMSPLSVAQFLDPSGLRFDAVVFDEASQVLPEDALGAIARAGQVILVGDENQLPPTNFFQVIGAVGAETPETGEEQTGIDAADLESILSLGKAAYPNSHVDLRWHYRSKHESLIEFSNHQFYNDRLRIFPSVSRDRTSDGLRLEFVEGAVYRRGTARDNPAEAQAVARAVIEHARTNPSRSLGVGAFSQAQQGAIEDEIEALRRENKDPEIESFFLAERDPFFVKNLETIQGDERDVIFLSVGYGRDDDARITMNFGPINQEGGWRRLNVLVTRARERCVVFSSITSDDVALRPGAPRGVEALKAYLYYAQHAALPGITTGTRGDHDSPFEGSVCRALREHGYDVHAQVGCAGFSIDLAIVDPAKPGRYALGIECDGASYHSTPTARDRDRIRQSVLEARGWTILRVWSTDWFNHPTQTLDRLLTQIRSTLDRTRSPDVERSGRPKPEPKQSTTAGPVGRPAGDEEKTTDDAPPYAEMKPYVRFRSRPLGDRDKLVRASLDRLSALIAKIVDIESPIHTDELFAAITRLYDTRTVGEAEEHLREALGHAEARGLVRVRRGFVWSGDDRPIVARWRKPDDAVTRAEHIAPEEVAEVARLVVCHEFSVPRAELPAAAIRAMGFSRAGSNLADLAERAVELAIESGLISPTATGALTASPPS